MGRWVANAASPPALILLYLFLFPPFLPPSCQVPMTVEELDLSCEDFLRREFGLRVDFTIEEVGAASSPCPCPFPFPVWLRGTWGGAWGGAREGVWVANERERGEVGATLLGWGGGAAAELHARRCETRLVGAGPGPGAPSPMGPARTPHTPTPSPSPTHTHTPHTHPPAGAAHP